MNHDKLVGNELIDFYQNLLTPRQKEVLYSYYQDDLSMNEIADNLGISKSAVSDNISRSLKQLSDFESKLKMIENYHKRIAIYEEIKSIADERIIELVDQLYDID